MYCMVNRRLDESVITLSILGTVKSAQKSQSSSRISLSETENRWCCLLDELSWLCDYRTGGKSVISIAAEAAATGNVFWFAGNNGPQPLVKRQLRWISEELRSVATSTPSEIRAVQWRLFRKSIMFNHRRVESYWTKLNSLVQNIPRNMTKEKDPLVANFLGQLIALRDDHEKLCLLAFDFRVNPSLARLRQHLQDLQRFTVWQAIRHYIGRLGSWWNACSVLVSTAQLHPGIFLNSRIRAVPSKPNAAIASLYDTNDRTPSQSLPSGQGAEDQRLVSNRNSGARDLATVPTAEFVSRLGRRRSHIYIHAELLVLNHFYQYNLAFADGVNYIGCSKLSCYCCQIYMEFHPRTVLPRPCHGNTWVRWAMPLLPTKREDQDQDGQDLDEDIKLLANMIRRTRHIIETGKFACPDTRQFESTTGLSGR